MVFDTHAAVSCLVRASLLSALLTGCASAPEESSSPRPHAEHPRASTGSSSGAAAGVSLTSAAPAVPMQTHVGAANSLLTPQPSCHVEPALTAQRGSYGLVCTGTQPLAGRPRSRPRTCSRSRQCSMPSHELGSEGTMDPARAPDSI